MGFGINKFDIFNRFLGGNIIGSWRYENYYMGEFFDYYFIDRNIIIL